MSLFSYIGYRLFPHTQDEAKCNFVSSRGLLKSCDFHKNRPRSSSDKLVSVSTSDLKSGDSIYVTTDALNRFKAELLPRISSPFVLVSGDSVKGVNPTLLGQETIEAILASPYLIKWFAQNLIHTHDKQVNMPLGLDYHTRTKTLRHHWGGFQTPLMQETDLIRIARNASDLENREVLGYCNWHFAPDRGTRRDCLDQIENSAAFFEPSPISRDRSWQTNAKMLFTISPTGAGMDCHRTWEAIILGTIPIVDKSELSPLFANLPVIEVDDWSIVTADFLKEQGEKALENQFDFGPLFLGYWKTLFRGETPKPLYLSFSDFVNVGVERAQEIYQ